jgi:hypothetical protein
VRLYTELRLKLLTGRSMAVHVEPPFALDDLEYTPGIRAVSLGNLTVLYEGMVFDVRPAGRVDYSSSPLHRLNSDASSPN